MGIIQYFKEYFSDRKTRADIEVAYREVKNLVKKIEGID